MKSNIIFSAVCLFVTLQAYAVESKKDNQTPFLPPAQVTGNAIISGVLTTHNSAFLSDSVLAPIVYMGGNQPPYILNHFKGDLGETLMNKVFTSSVLKKTGGWQSVSPANTGRNGIDGLYLKLNKAGLPEQLMVADAKVNSAQLGQTKLGKQMSESWIKPKLAQTASSYKNISSVESGAIKFVKTRPVNIKNAIEIPMANKSSAFVWKTPEGYSCFSPNSTITPEQIRKQASTIGSYIQAAADGKINYRSRLFTYKAENGQHVISIKQLNSQGNVITEKTQWVKGEYAKLPKDYRTAISKTARSTLKQQKNIYGFPKYSQKELNALVRRCCDNPEDFSRLCVRPRLSSPAVRLASTVIFANALPAGLDIVTQYCTTGEINWRQTGTITLLAGTSTTLGLATTNAMTSAGCSTVMSSIAGGSLAGAVMSYAMYAMGYCSLNDAHFSAGLGVTTAAATALTPVVMMSIAVAYGTTSTGVAISSLSGAALTNACLAWWGGGAIAAGGGGMAAGGTTIAIYTGGVALIIIAPVAIYSTYKYFSDSAAQERYLRGMIDNTTQRVKNNNQPEWEYLPSI